MAVPEYDYLRYAFLKYSSDGKVHHIQQTVDALANYFDLSIEDREALTKNGKNYEFRYRCHWVKTYLTKANLLDAVGRGKYQITRRGVEFFEAHESDVITRIDLMQFPEFAEFATPARQTDHIENFGEHDESEEQTPEDVLENTYQQLAKALKDDLLDTVLSVSPAFFERLVVNLLLAMGYGSSLDSGDRIGQSGDGGVDGVIREDKLGLDTIYIQAKRYARDNGVGRPAIQGFVGSLMGIGATKGVFITTSYFSKQAIEYADSINNLKVILIDGQQLATLMIEHNVGVSVQRTYEIKQIDENYFPDV